MNRHGIVIKRISLLSVAFLLAITIGCAPVQTKSTGGRAETKAVNEVEKETLEVASQDEYLRVMLMSFADTFATEYVTQ